MSKQLYRQSETVFIKRSQINFAAYNPKKHEKEAIAKIKANFKKVAFLGGIIWNETTKNLIDGHKRVMTLDAIHNYVDANKNDYDIKVEKIALDEKTEKEQNVFQSTSITQFDTELLSHLISDIDLDNAGITDQDLRMIELEVPDFEFTTETDATKAFDGIKKTKEERKEEMQKIRKANKLDTFEGGNYVTLTFSSFEAKAFFMERFGFDHYDEFIKGERFEAMLEKI